MRRLFFVLIIVLHAISALAGSVLVQPQLIALVPTMEQLVDTCATSGKYDACTRFVAYRLKATCSESVSSWKIDATATFLPFVLLHNIQQLPHEQMHIGDVRISLQRYVDDLGAGSFATKRDCEQKALLEIAGFGQRLRELALESNLARHPQLRRITQVVPRSR